MREKKVIMFRLGNWSNYWELMTKELRNLFQSKFKSNSSQSALSSQFGQQNFLFKYLIFVIAIYFIRSNVDFKKEMLKEIKAVLLKTQRKMLNQVKLIMEEIDQRMKEKDANFLTINEFHDDNLATFREYFYSVIFEISDKQMQFTGSKI